MRGTSFRVSVVVASLIASCAADAAEFQGLDFLGGLARDSRANGISADGSVVVGQVTLNNNYYQGFRWNRFEGMVGLPDLPGGETASQASGVSQDGSVVVGHGYVAGGAEAVYWIDDGPAGIGRLASPGDSLAIAASRDGSVIAGISRVPGAWNAFRWTSAGGMVGLGSLAGGRGESLAEDISSDGAVIVGRSSSSRSEAGLWEAFRWSAAGGMQPLGDFPGSLFYSAANAVSDDGRVVIGMGSASRAFNGEPFRWTAEEGLVPLFGTDQTPPVYSSSALDVSADGSVIVGFISPDESQAFIWDDANGIRLVEDVLRAGGVDVGAWELREATGVSADGLTLAGWGVNPEGKTEAWVAVVPEPMGVGAMWGAAALLLRRRGRHRGNGAGRWGQG